MPLKVTFELSDKDLRHFKQVMKDARAKAQSRPEAKLIQSAKELLDHVRDAEMPEFVRERLLQLEVMTAMLEDDEWALEGQDRERVTSALAYFDEPLDLIPDHVPGFGFLDDAVMVELVVLELKHDIEAFEDFCAYRKSEEKRRGRSDDEVTRAQWIGSRRKQLHQRMRRRRRSRARSASRSGSGRSPFSLW